MKQLVLASGNAGKLKELSALLAPLGIEVLPQSAFNVTEAEEPTRALSRTPSPRPAMLPAAPVCRACR
jgi:inosine/xanthosine triphosphate pyrophosphatase family protein